MALLYKALRLNIVSGSYNPLNIIELYKRSGNVSILSFTIYRELSKCSPLADNIFIEELRYTFRILILKGVSFHLSITALAELGRTWLAELGRTSRSRD